MLRGAGGLIDSLVLATCMHIGHAHMYILPTEIGPLIQISSSLPAVRCIGGGRKIKTSPAEDKHGWRSHANSFAVVTHP